MDLSMILSPDVGDDDGGYGSNQHAPHEHQQRRQQHPDGYSYSAAEMQCAVAILQDFQPPHASPNRPQHLHHHSQQQYSAQEEQRPPPFLMAGHRSRELVFDEEQKSGHEDDEDEDAASTPHSATSASASGWASGSDLMSKLDLLVQADEMIQSSSAERPPAAQASAASSAAASGSPQQFFRSGVWTRAEEEYAAALIYFFLKGLLPLKEGTTLRKFLAEKLCCNRRRVSMKLATESIANKKIPRKVGASVFVTAHPTPTTAERDQVLDTLASLRMLCFDPVASPGLESRQRPTRIHDELPELLLRAPQVEPHQHYRHSHEQLDQSYEHFELQYQDRGSPQKENREKQASSDHSFLRSSSEKQPPPDTPQKKPKKKPSVGTHHQSQHYRREPVPELLRSPPGTGNIKRRKPTIIRTGFETVEEEKYVTAMFEYFMAGVLDLPEGTRLISYLCGQLSCSPKTLSMKLAPRRLGERKFPDNVGSITYMRKDSKKNSFMHDPETIALRLSELRVACFDYENATPNPPTQPKQQQQSHSKLLDENNANSQNVKSERKNSTASNSSSVASPSRLLFSRSGPWSREEELYAAALIDCFFKGVLDIAEGTTLRAFLSSRLCCNPMRISKKLASEWIADIKIPKKLGSSTFVRRGSVTTEEQLETEAALRKLQHAYLHSETIKDDQLEDEGERAAVVGAKHSRPEEPEDEDMDREDNRASSSTSSEEDNAAALSSSSLDDIKSLSGKSPKKIRKVLATKSSPVVAKALATTKKTKSKAKKLTTTTTTASRRKATPPASPSSSTFRERVASLAY